ncbi:MULTISPECIES: spore germination protein [Paenibacillus]|uniref:Spore germination protein n=1 Tax=Paenibacillus albilobatus TaxID=2716884 RepID=A0A919XH76_9BACL|nr:MULTISPECIES: spore germination protein [Paenibacillus]GIO31313.1 spore germination protein [Paenibacillus albilobatus]
MKKTPQQSENKQQDLPLSLDNLKGIFQDCDDIVFRPLEMDDVRGTFIFFKDMIADQALSEIQKVIFNFLLEGSAKPESSTQLLKALNSRFVTGKIAQSNETSSIINDILEGNAVLLLEGMDSAFVFQTADTSGRSIEEPPTDQVVRGPREGFVEQLDTNIKLIRRKISSPSLKVQYLTLGKQTKTRLALVYVREIANDGIVEEVRRRIMRIEIDSVLGSNYIEEMIGDAPYSPFPTIYNAERPDRICGDLLEGKVAILVDGTPFALTAPALFVEFFQSNEDYYDSFYSASIIRLVRIFGALIALLLPAFYVAVSTIHQDLIPTPFLIHIAGFRADLPFPIVVEAIFMQITFEVVREAGLRMPKAIGSAVTIVGTLVIGEAAVQAGIIGSLMVIIVALTALTTFVLPNYKFMQVFRFGNIPMLILASLFGLMGIIVGLMFILAHLCSIRSFGVPYLSPIAPVSKGWKDVFIRAPWWSLENRNPVLSEKNVRRGHLKPPLPPKK